MKGWAFESKPFQSRSKGKIPGRARRKERLSLSKLKKVFHLHDCHLFDWNCWLPSPGILRWLPVMRRSCCWESLALFVFRVSPLRSVRDQGKARGLLKLLSI